MPSYSIFEIPSIGIPNLAAKRGNGSTAIPDYMRRIVCSRRQSGGYTPGRPVADLDNA